MLQLLHLNVLFCFYRSLLHCGPLFRGPGCQPLQKKKESVRSTTAKLSAWTKNTCTFLYLRPLTYQLLPQCKAVQQQRNQAEGSISREKHPIRMSHMQQLNFMATFMLSKGEFLLLRPALKTAILLVHSFYYWIKCTLIAWLIKKPNVSFKATNQYGMLHRKCVDDIEY